MKPPRFHSFLWILLLLHISTTSTKTDGECYFERSNLNSMGLIKTLTCSNITPEALHQFTKPLDTLVNINIFNSKIPQVDNETFSVGNSSVVVKLSLNNDKIAEIDEKALAAFSNLKILSISNNLIKRVDFLHNQQLLELALNNNSISELHDGCFSNLPLLYLLDLTYNKIGRMENAMSTLPGLKQLYLNRNEIRALEGTTFDNNGLLVILNMEFNQLEIIENRLFRKLENLRELYLNDNLLREVEVGAFQTLKNLWFLRLSNNRLEMLKSGMFAGLVSMEHLHLEENLIQTIEPGSFLDLRSLSFLNVQGNKVNALENGTFKGLQRLSLLNLTKLGVERIDSGAFAGLDVLQTLDLDGNRIEVLETHGFGGLSSLENLLLANNTIQLIRPKAFSGLTRLIMLNIRDANISSLGEDAFSGLPALATLEIMALDIREVQPGTFKGLDNLITLVLGNYKIRNDVLHKLDLQNGTFDGLHKLKALYLKNLRIAAIRSGAFSGSAELRHINFQNCTITNINMGAFSGLDNLDNIKTTCSHDKLVSTGRSFKLCNLSIESIEAGALKDLYVDDGFSYMPNSLYLSSNKLSVVVDNTFSRISNMVELTLDHNNLHEVQTGAFNGLSFHPQPCSYAIYYQYDREARALMCNTLYLNNNLLKILKNGTFSDMRNLVSLRLDYNDIEDVEADTFTGLYFSKENNSTVFNTLYLNNNKLKILKSGCFGKIENLAVLKLDDNLIEKIEPNVFNGLNFQLPSDRETIKNAIYLNSNKLSVILSNTFHGIKHITMLQLDNNNIKRISPGAFNGLQFSNIVRNLKTNKLNVLNLNHNKLMSLSSDTFFGIQNLIELKLDFNSIETIENGAFSTLNQLLTLTISNNKIYDIKDDLLKNLPHLQMLDLSSNRILSIRQRSFSGAINLRQLLICCNRVADVPVGAFNDLSALESLQLGGNSLSKFRTGTFSKLNRLKYLNISHNKFSTFNENALYPLRNLEMLVLNNNNLTFLNHSSLLTHLPSLRFVSINNNNWPCHSLIYMAKDFRKLRVSYLFNTTSQYSEENVDGIKCTEVEDISKEEKGEEYRMWAKQIMQSLDEWKAWQSNNSHPENVTDIINLLDNMNSKFDELIFSQKLDNWRESLSNALGNLANSSSSNGETLSHLVEVVSTERVNSESGVTLSLSPFMTMLVLLMFVSSVTICLVLIVTPCSPQAKKLKQIYKLRKAESEMELLDTSA